jgi:hypothetical protein
MKEISTRALAGVVGVRALDAGAGENENDNDATFLTARRPGIPSSYASSILCCQHGWFIHHNAIDPPLVRAALISMSQELVEQPSMQELRLVLSLHHTPAGRRRQGTDRPNKDTTRR